MYLNQYSVRVVGGNEIAGGYVEMAHEQTYELSLRNSRNTRCDARVEIDGKHVGTWRVPAHQSITLERPAHDQGQFTFYKLGSYEGQQAGLDEGNPNLGLVKVTFTPEKAVTSFSVTYTPEEPYPLPEPKWRGETNVTYTDTNTGSISYAAAPQAKGLSSGGTGLSGHSHQQFGQAAWMNLDYSQSTTIHLRLVCKENGPRPLTSYSTPVPPRV